MNIKSTKSIHDAFDKAWSIAQEPDPRNRAHTALSATLPAAYINCMRVIADTLGSGVNAPTTIWEIAKELRELADELEYEEYYND